jgi:hypothetical protein
MPAVSSGCVVATSKPNTVADVEIYRLTSLFTVLCCCRVCSGPGCLLCVLRDPCMHPGSTLRGVSKPPLQNTLLKNNHSFFVLVNLSLFTSAAATPKGAVRM